jgi:hypothetical protein
MSFIKRNLIFLLIASLLLSVSSPAIAKEVSSKKASAAAPKKFPAFPKEGKWLNVGLLKRKGNLKDKITLVYFWDYTSINSIREMKAIQEWKRIYKPYGFQVIWVHSPEFRIGADKTNLQKAIQRFDIEDPVFADSFFKLWDAADVRSWPTKILTDEKGQIVYTKNGEGQYFDTETQIRSHLKQLEPASVLPDPVYAQNVETYDPISCGDMTSETYLGNKKSSWWGAKLGNEQYASPNETLVFKDRGQRAERGFFLEGAWTNREEYMEHARYIEPLKDYTGMIYQAREVYVVAESAVKDPVKIYVTRDDKAVPPGYDGKDIKTDEKKNTYFELTEPRLYYLIEGDDSDLHEIKLWSSDPGVRFYSFSFSNYCLADFEHR